MDETRDGSVAVAPLNEREIQLGLQVICGDAFYLRGSTASFNCFAIRALTTVFAGILIASPVAGLRPIRAFRF